MLKDMAMPSRPYPDWDAVLAYSSAALCLTEQDVEELRSERNIKSTKVGSDLPALRFVCIAVVCQHKTLPVNSPKCRNQMHYPSCYLSGKVTFPELLG